jgi:hypothetical protein
MLTLPTNYSSALGQNIKENYLVQIYDDQGNARDYLSVSSTTVDSIDYSGVITNIPNIRESIDLNKSTSSLANISISCANDDLDGLLYSTRTRLNRDVKIYSQLNNEADLADCLLVFKGILRAVQSSENKITLQISAKRPFENIQIPQKESVNGNLVPVVFGDYSSHSFGSSLLGVRLQTDTINCHPVPVDTIQGGRIITLAHEDDSSTVTNGYLHVVEKNLFRTTGSENLAKAGGTLLNNETSTELEAQDGTTIYGRSAQLNLRRSFVSNCSSSDDQAWGDFLDDDITFSADYQFTTTNQLTLNLAIDKIGSILHTPESALFTLEFSNVNINIADFSSYRVLYNVYWGSDSSAGVTNFVAANRLAPDDNVINIADITTYFITNQVFNENTITNDADNTGNLPSKIDIVFEFNRSGSGSTSFDIDFDVKATFGCTTQLDESQTNVQSTTEIVDNIGELYSGQDGHTLSGESTVIKYPIEAHRYLCETFMPSEFTSSRPSSYTNIRSHFLPHGNSHYYVNKKIKLEDALEKLQHFGGFIMRYKNDGTFDYTSPSFLPTTTTSSATSPYLINIGTLQTTGGSGISASDTSFGIDITHGSEDISNGDIIAISNVLGYEFIKVFLSDTAIPGADRYLAQCERLLLPSNCQVSFAYSENTTIYKVKLPHSKLQDNDFTNLQLSHLPLNDISTKFKILYHKDPSSTNKYLELKEFDNSENRTKYNIGTENVKEVKNEIDVKGDLSDFYYHHYGNLTSSPRLKVSFELLNPSFYSLEVGDIIQFDGSNTTQKPFGLLNKGYTATSAWERLYFVVTSTSRTIGKMSVSAHEIY